MTALGISCLLLLKTKLLSSQKVMCRVGQVPHLAKKKKKLQKICFEVFNYLVNLFSTIAGLVYLFTACGMLSAVRFQMFHYRGKTTFSRQNLNWLKTELIARDQVGLICVSGFGYMSVSTLLNLWFCLNGRM